jgi:hypothetical protein
MNIERGVRLLEEKKGSGLAAKRGDHITYNLRIYLNRGDEIPINNIRETDRENLKQNYPDMFTNEEGYKFLNFNTRLGRRDVLKGIEYSLSGMREGGYRKVKLSPNLAYQSKGIPGKIPFNAAIICEIWLRKVKKEEPVQTFSVSGKANKAAYQISSSMNEGILEIIVTGKLALSSYEKITNELSAIAKANSVEKLLIDIRALDGRLGITETYIRVRNYSKHMYKIRFAMVDIPENAGYETFRETTSMRAGMLFKWFTDIDEARTWLNSR